MRPNRSRRAAIDSLKTQLTPKRPVLHDRIVVTDEDGQWQITSAPVVGAGRLVLPVMLSLDTWEAQAAASQDKLVMEARDQRVQIVGEDVLADTSLQYRNRRH